MSAQNSPALSVSRSQSEVQTLSCMEIWGGNTHVRTNAELPGLRGWVYSQPLQPATSGGDVYYLSVCSAGLLSRIVLADVSGHGQLVGGLAVELRDLVRKNVNVFDQSALVRDINEAFRKSRGRVNEFATATVLGYYCEDRELVFVNAGHPPALWYRAEQRTWEWLHPDTPLAETAVEGLPLGLIPGTDYRQTVVRLGPRDIILLYTDGFTESCNPAGDQLGYEGLLEIARMCDTDDPARTGPQLLDGLAKFRGGVLTDDDLSLLVLQETERKPGATA
jgi:phosphoserine phosphatase RsbU/P